MEPMAPPPVQLAIVAAPPPAVYYEPPRAAPLSLADAQPVRLASTAPQATELSDDEQDR